MPVSEPNNWILPQLRVAFSQELKRRARAMTKTQSSLFLYMAYFCQRRFSDWLLGKEADWRIPIVNSVKDISILLRCDGINIYSIV